MAVLYVCYVCGLLWGAKVTVAWSNIALSRQGSICEEDGGPKLSNQCALAFDGELRSSSSWISAQPKSGIWIKVSFNKRYDLTWGRFMQRYNANNQNKDIRLEYESGQNQKVRLTELQGSGSSDYSVRVWDEVPLDHVITSYVRIEIVTVYTLTNNGFTEVEFYTETNPCPGQFSYVQEAFRCYLANETQAYTWQKAHDACVTRGSRLVALETEEEFNTIQSWYLKNTHDRSNIMQQVWTSAELTLVTHQYVWPSGDVVMYGWPLVSALRGYKRLVFGASFIIRDFTGSDKKGFFCESGK